MAYRKQQKLSGRKVLRFIALHPSVGKTFVVFASSVWKVLKKVNIPQENFCDSSKTIKLLTFVTYGILANPFVL